MATFAKVELSGGTDGRGIKVVATSSTGTTIHATGNSSTVFDEVWLWAYNSHTGDVVLTIERGSTTDPDDHIVLTIPFDAGLVAVVPGLILTGTGSGANTVTAFAATANVIALSGYVNRIS